LGNAYGFCVVLVTFLTTNLVAIVALVVWRMHSLVVLAIFLPFLVLDGLFLSSAGNKLPDGAWFTLLLALILSSVFVLWRYGKEKQWAAEGRGRYDFSQFIKKNELQKWTMITNDSVRELTNIKGIAIYFDKSGEGVPIVYEEFLRKFEALPDIQVLFHLRALSRPYVSEDEKYEVMRTSVPNCYRIIVRHGYKDVVVTQELDFVVYAQIKNFILTTPAHAQPSTAADSQVASSSGFQEGAETSPAASMRIAAAEGDQDMKVARRLEALNNAYDAQTVFVSLTLQVYKSECKLINVLDCWKGTTSSCQGEKQHLQTGRVDYLPLA
jgi:KUP system potassium uptake protein